VCARIPEPEMEMVSPGMERGMPQRRILGGGNGGYAPEMTQVVSGQRQNLAGLATLRNSLEIMLVTKGNRAIESRTSREIERCTLVTYASGR